jgi:hypothetical protein
MAAGTRNPGPVPGGDYSGVSGNEDETDVAALP